MFKNEVGLANRTKVSESFYDDQNNLLVICSNTVKFYELVDNLELKR